MTETREGNIELFWKAVRDQLLTKPHEVVLVTTYNHPTLAYRARRDINLGTNPIFPEKDEWFASIVKHNTPYYGVRSGKVTYKFDFYLTYRPGKKA